MYAALYRRGFLHVKTLITKLVVLGLLESAACTPIAEPPHQAAATSKANAERCSDAANGCSTAAADAHPAQGDAAKTERDAGSPRHAPGMTGAGAAAAAGKQPPAAANGGKPADAGMAQPEAGALAAAAADDAASAQPALTVDDTPVPPDDSECEYVELRARNDAAGAPYQAKSGDYLQCFLIDAGFDAKTQAFGFSPLLDNANIVTDMVLRTLDYSDNRGPLITCNDPYPTHQMVSFWAPGADNWYYPKDMGIDLGRGLFILEVHYDNKGAAATDRSGMRVCTSKQLRPRTAMMSWLGSRNFSVPGNAKNYAVNGRCAPVNQSEPIHILRVSPYMNQLGRRAAMQVDRIDGSTQPVFDEPFDVTDHKIYDTPTVVRVGDTVLSSCYFDNPKPNSVLIGIKNSDELCHMLVLAYPPHALVDSAWSVENNSCTGSP